MLLMSKLLKLIVFIITTIFVHLIWIVYLNSLENISSIYNTTHYVPIIMSWRFYSDSCVCRCHTTTKTEL